MHVALALERLAGRTVDAIGNGATSNLHVIVALDTVVIGVERQRAVADEDGALAVNAHGLVLDGRALHARTIQDKGIVGLGALHAAGVNGAVSPVTARAVDVDVTRGAGHRAVALHTASAVAGHGDVNDGFSAVDGEVAVGADTCRLLDLAVLSIPDGNTRVLQRQGTALDVDVALGLDALGACSTGVDGERTALDEHVTVLLGERDIFGINLDTVVTATLDVDGTAVHLEVL